MQNDLFYFPDFLDFFLKKILLSISKIMQIQQHTWNQDMGPLLKGVEPNPASRSLKSNSYLLCSQQYF